MGLGRVAPDLDRDVLADGVLFDRHLRDQRESRPAAIQNGRLGRHHDRDPVDQMVIGERSARAVVGQPLDESKSNAQSGIRTGTDGYGNCGEIGNPALGLVEHRLN